MSGLRLDPKGLVVFVGAGPGADDLITVRGARVIAEADIIIWASSLVRPGIVADHKPGAEVIDSASIPLEDLVPLSTPAPRAKTHPGAPATAFGVIGSAPQFSIFSLESPMLIIVIGSIFIVSLIASIQPLLRNVRRNPVQDIRD